MIFQLVSNHYKFGQLIISLTVEIIENMQFITYLLLKSNIPLFLSNILFKLQKAYNLINVKLGKDIENLLIIN